MNDYLATRGIAASRMRTVSYGKERPVAVCNDISCWSQNRRSVSVLDGGAGDVVMARPTHTAWLLRKGRWLAAWREANLPVEKSA